MSFPGPFPVTPLTKTSTEDINIRPMQRITAEVMRVTGVQAILSIEGYPVVAKLTSQDQAAALSSRRFAQFIVSQLSDKEIVLKFVNGSNQFDTISARPVGQDVAVRLTSQMGLEPTAENMLLANAALSHNLQISNELMNELLGVLQQLGDWGAEEADMAAALKEAGLPLTPDSLRLAMQPDMRLGVKVVELLGLLKGFDPAGIDQPELAEMLKSSLALLQEVIPDLSKSPEELAQQLNRFTSLFGRSCENILAQHLQQPNALWPETSLLTLVKLGQELGREGHTDLARTVDQFLEAVRQDQFMNVKPDPVPGRGEWNQIDFAVQIPGKENQPEYLPSRLQVTYRETTKGRKIDPDFTRLVIQVDLEPGKPVQVDLSLLNKMIRAEVKTSDAVLGKLTKDSLPDLVQRLEDLGYQTVQAGVSIGEVNPPVEIKPTSKIITGYRAVDMEV